MPDVLSTRVLNRALLERQMLLDRAALTPEEAVERLVGLQAQAPLPPYVALWSRLRDFDPETVSTLLLERKLVRVALMRSTIHLVAGRDLWLLRPVVQPAIERSTFYAHGRDLTDEDKKAIAAAATEALANGPMTLNELGSALRTRWPDVSAADLGMTARALVPLVQVPPRGVWGKSGRAAHLDAGRWLGKSRRGGTVDDLVLRYLRAFGPASPADAQTWSGLTGLNEVFQRLRPQLRVYENEAGKEVFDVADAALPSEDLDAPVRFLGEYDNLTLSHADRSRVVDASVRRYIASRNGQVPGMILVDGFVHGTWRVESGKKLATLVIRPLVKLTKQQWSHVEAEGKALLDLLAGGIAHELRREAAATAQPANSRGRSAP